ncbi:hypothetical protein ACQ4M3_22090 [Leptolyngbya sp. AN03gr2]|uniref:hypothetical protein n=1 Tax=unclassified Leptolyngbya TaxID=2650499 RepID=UPI003D318DF3
MLKYWQYKLVLGIALIASGTLIVHTGQQRSATLLALDTNTGKIQWFRPLRSEKDFYSRGAIASNGTVILGSAESSQPEQRSSDTYRSWVDAESLYLNCYRRQNNQASTTTMSLSSKTGQIQWQTLDISKLFVDLDDRRLTKLILLPFH